jgi:hypothetical protein
MSLFDNPHNIVYPNTSEVPMKNKKPTDTWMQNYTLDERKAKFFEFCSKFDDRQDDLLKDDFQIFSHRLHWHEHPYVERYKDENRDLVYRLRGFKKIWYTILFSFSNEHWGTMMALDEGGQEGLRERFERHRHARSDLFQIYYPKGTKVAQWLIDAPLKCAYDMRHVLDDRKEKWTMMELAKTFETYFKGEGFRSPLYPCKNFARYMAMTWPDQVDPESVLFGGTGHFDGMHQIFGGKNLNGKVKYDIVNGAFIPENEAGELWMEQMEELSEDPRNPMTSQKLLNIEDKTCFFYKHMAISHGAKRPTKRIPRDWIFPREFKLES